MSIPIVPFSYPGGKARKLRWLLAHINVPCSVYLEPFCGSCTVLFNRAPVQVETINDFDGELINFFRVLQSGDYQRLRDNLEFTPYHRDEYEGAFVDAKTPKITGTPFERARNFFLRAVCGHVVIGHLEIAFMTTKCPQRPNRKTMGVENWANNLKKKVKLLDVYIERLKSVQIENVDALKFIKMYDVPGALFYCDPPYISSDYEVEQNYAARFGLEQHKEMLTMLMKSEAKVAISGYYHELYADTLLPAGWCMAQKDVPKTIDNTKKGGKRKRVTECLWMNYKPGLRGSFF